MKMGLCVLLDVAVLGLVTVCFARRRSGFESRAGIEEEVLPRGLVLSPDFISLTPCPKLLYLRDESNHPRSARHRGGMIGSTVILSERFESSSVI